MDTDNRWILDSLYTFPDPFCVVTDAILKEVERLTEPGCLPWEEKDVLSLRLSVSEINA